VGLTTNIKIMVDSSYNLSLSSIESKDELSNSKFKKVNFVKKNYYDELITYFYDGLPPDTAFYIKYENDVDSMSNDYSAQYDEIYQYGARNITNNKNYKEEFEYFAPLYISPNNLPKSFIIFRVDGAGIDTITKDNFKNNILNKFKTVKVFDLTRNTGIGEWLDFNFNKNSFFPLTPFEMSFQNLEFSKWNGIDYETGGYTSKSQFLESVYEEEKEIYEFEKFVFDGYQNNKLVFPNILNMSFLFDDTPANSDTLRKWSINRYYGFYVEDMIKVKSISPYITPFIKSNVIIQEGNILYSPTGDPFVEGFLDHKVYYVEYDGEYYKVEKFQTVTPNVLQSVQSGNVITQQYTNKVTDKYRIISDIDLTGKQSMLNKGFGTIASDDSPYPNRLLNYDNTNYLFDEWDSSDVWLIEIDGMYHNLVRETGPELVNGIRTNTTKIKINSDYSFKINQNDYTYWINKSDPRYTKNVSFVVDKDNAPKKFNIYKLKFTDIKDFDDKIIDTEYSKYEYENKFTLTDTDETKMYLTNLDSKTFPKNYDDFTYNSEVVNIPVSSEYTANYETFKIDRGSLSEIWRKNATYCRWGFQNSLSANDVPYLLNNSLTFEDYNRTANPFDPDTKRIERNLDYFYTINSSTSSYIHHTLHVEKQTISGIDNTFKFELNKYLNLATYSVGTGSATYSFDYFSYFFERNANFDNFKVNKNVKKYSLFNTGNNSIPNISLFKGIKFLIYNVDDIKKDETGAIGVLNLKTSNEFDGYKFSILLSDNDWSVVNSPSVNNVGVLTQSQNSMNWTIFDDWKMDKSYKLNDIVVKDDILYQSSTVSNITTSPVKEYALAKKAMSAPYNQVGWVPYTTVSGRSIFWSPIGGYPGSGVGDNADIVYNNGDYYFYNASGSHDFWSPTKSDSVAGYTMSEVVLFKGKYYMSTTASNHYRPDYQQPYKVTRSFSSIRSGLEGISVFENVGSYYWVETQSSSPKWRTISVWNPSVSYANTYIVHNGVVYSCVSSATGNEPGVSTDWKRQYSLVPDTSIVYNSSTNPIIEMNDSYYMINTNDSNSTLENGINIYINKKWKNILVNINIADNTIPNVSESDRDIMYGELNKKLTANNFIQCINDLSNKYGFTDYINYVIINEDGSINRYNYNNIEGLPYHISCETPEEVVMKYDSIIRKPIALPKKLKPVNILSSVATNLSNLNYYNNISVAAEISPNKDTPKPIANLHGSKNITEEVIYRFSGFYMPVFYDIQLFNKNSFTASVGNYKFDTTLTDFGLIKERKVRKVNHNGSVLKLNNVKDEKSIYPMVQEFGYTTINTFIFKSTWDLGYHHITSNNTIVASNLESRSRLVRNPGLIGIQNPIKNINL
jgi:hypothetical protein